MKKKGYFKSHQQWINGPKWSGPKLFKNGAWNGWSVFNDRKDEFTMDLDFTDGALTGSGTNNNGRFVFNGLYNGDTLRMAITRQYIGKHFAAEQIRVEYDVTKKEFNGVWYLVCFGFFISGTFGCSSN